MTDIPQWALARARELSKEQSIFRVRAYEAFARYIAEHEDPPVEPEDRLSKAARYIAAKVYLKAGYNSDLTDKISRKMMSNTIEKSINERDRQLAFNALNGAYGDGSNGCADLALAIAQNRIFGMTYEKVKSNDKALEATVKEDIERNIG